MPEIKVLDPHVADLIAAGEVVERPASVVKELAENAIDAGAHTVTVEIQRGGMAMIRVTDDGCGIPADQCATAFLRHATSKLRAPGDLAANGTLGFRGEALAAIAAVSRVELFTRTADAPLGLTLTIEGGELLSREEAGCPLGTTLVVRDLFFNTPARLKFMKRDAAEGAAVFALVQKLALSHPEIALRFLRDGRQELSTPGDGKLASALYAVFGRDVAPGFTPVDSRGEDVSVSGFVTLPACCRGSRNYQHFFVNGRQVKSRLLMTALEKAYENQKMVGRFPGCVLHVTLRPSAVDVNVHPAKTEVKFLSDRQVFDGVYYAVLSALGAEDRHPALTLDPAAPAAPVGPAAPARQTAPVPKPGGGFARMTAQEYRASAPLREGGSNLLRPMARPGAEEGVYTALFEQKPQVIHENPPKQTKKDSTSVENPGESVENPRKTGAFSPLTAAKAPQPESFEPTTIPLPPQPPREEEVPPAPAPGADPSPAPAPPAAEVPWRLAGEVLNTYLIVEQGDNVYLIDKHAARERLNFDRMKAQGYEPMVQTLLVPEIFTPAPEEAQVLLDHLPLLARYGFACEDFGGGALAVREIPDYLDPGGVAPALSELAQALLTGDRADPDSARDAVLHTMACKAAVKGGQRNSREELLVVAQAVVSGQVKYCPHGRPVAVTLTRRELERQFKRT